jgi:transcriptional regulator GlxA family with amidase domain
MAIVFDGLGWRMQTARWSLQERFSGAPLVLMRTLDHVLAELAGHGVIGHAGLNTTVAAAVDFIAGHYAEPLSVTAVANAVRLSVSRLAHVFPEATGLAVMDYVARLRVNIARRLLLESSDTIDKIAARIGFADASNFSRTFKGIDGMAPGEFRRSKQSA